MILCIGNGLIVNPQTGLQAIGDLWVVDGKIACIKTEQGIEGTIPVQEGNHSSMERMIDATGKLVTPGLIDLHVHFREPGFEYKEDIESGCNAAARGGFTTVCPMPNTVPVIDNPVLVEYIKEKADKGCGVNVLPVGAITEGQQGYCLAELDGMAKVGVCAFSEDGKSVMDAELMREAMIKASAMNLPILDHAEDVNMPGSMISEELIVARDILLASETGCRLHLCHISTKGSLEIIRNAKKQGIPVTAETAPHYFTLSKSDVKGEGNKKMNPPLRGRSHIIAIKKALADGTLDAIATDHAPHSSDEKEVRFDQALNGVIGLETSFPISYMALVQDGTISLMELIALMSSKPAAILGIEKGDLSIGKPADIAIFDLEYPYEIKADEFASKSRNCPFIGRKVYGKTLYTIVDGNVIYSI